MELTDARFARDVEHLVLVLADRNDVLASTVPVRVDERHPYRPWLGAAAAVPVVGAALTYWQFFRELPPSGTAPSPQILSSAVKPAPDNHPVAPLATVPAD